jgi:catabolite regulation protein CreA
MIAPHKYLDLNLSLINLGGIIISIIKAEQIIKYDDLLNRVIAHTSENSKQVFTQSLSFLFILGKIKYNTNNDTLEYLLNETK